MSTSTPASPESDHRGGKETNRSAKNAPSWRDDLLASRDLNKQEKQGFEMLLGWLDQWRIARRMKPGRDAAEGFWKQQVVVKEREQWQLDQWCEAIRWYLGWVECCRAKGGIIDSSPGRRDGHPLPAGTPGTCRREDDGDLYPCRTEHEWLRGAQSARSVKWAWESALPAPLPGLLCWCGEQSPGPRPGANRLRPCRGFFVRAANNPAGPRLGARGLTAFNR